MSTGVSTDISPEFRVAYLRHVGADELPGRDDAEIDAMLRSHLTLAAQRPQGRVAVRVHTPEHQRAGWSADGASVVEIVTDDMPFLVDSVAAELTRTDYAIALLIHPQIVVRRDITGTLLGLADPAAPTPQDTPESWMHLEITPRVDGGAAAQIEIDLCRVLSDVRDAVEDWHKMGDAAFNAAEDLLGGAGIPTRDTDPERAEAWELLRWLADNHFTFLGYREYSLETVDGDVVLGAVPGTGLGILRSDRLVSSSFEALTPDMRARARDPRPMLITKATSRSTVHRPAYLDYIGVKVFDASGAVTGERRFLGLFSRAAYAESVARIPVLRRKVDALYDATGFHPSSHSGRDLLEAVETFPRDELFATSVSELTAILLSVLALKERRRLRLFLRHDEFDRFVSALVYLPRDRYDTASRVRIQEILLEACHGVSVEYTSRVTESVLARLHFVIRVDPERDPDKGAMVDAAELEDRLVRATRTWREELSEALEERYDPASTAELTDRYAEAFPAGYIEANTARAAVDDVARLEALRPESVSVRLYESRDAEPGRRRFTVYRRGGALSLSDVLPILTHLGVEVTDEQPYSIEVTGEDGSEVETWIYDFGLRTEASTEPTPVIKAMFEEAFLAVRDGRAESDGFNRLIPRAGLTWEQAAVLRAYAKYLRQAGTTFGIEYIESVVAAHADIARMLVALFEARFDPALGAPDDADRLAVCAALTADLAAELDDVSSLDADRILRAYLALIAATLRTNRFATDSGGAPPLHWAFKLDPRAIPDLPAPRPRFEIWVYSPAVEGVHLRFGPVARGGLRWSDRREDFRTEILGLVKAQMVKNAVIVPVGAKGGFVVKRPPMPTGDADLDREAQAAGGVACYRAFIGALLDVTDNLAQGNVVPPAGVVRHDGDDAYLVVAADKGTARFSDIANEISVARGFWLGDAFASGGSAGYDHKAMGITARGAWESVKRHFRERGIDCQSEDFTCVGVGDMSGDVFGNGMLLSSHIRLIAAFDHRHVFLDPDPDSAASFTERARLFALPRSSWADYDTSKISAGGGVYPRSAKSIPISAQVRAALRLGPNPDGSEISALTSPDLLRAILRAEVDLLWNGGIGTYLKSAIETHAEVGDKANDAIRVNGIEVRAECVGEGGNLGATQLGRIEYARAGGRINTDAIDNSAGVDTSDREVNIKIALTAAIAAGDLATAERDAFLASMTGEVAALVLADNYAQNTALANAAAQAPALLHAHARVIRALEDAGLLDRAIEYLPTDSDIATRATEGTGLSTPELAVLLAYTKITLYDRLLASDLPETAALARVPREYFPAAMRGRFQSAIDAHPLRREILTTAVVNDLVNDAGITFGHRVREETGAGEVDIVRAYLVARDVYDLEGFREQIAALDARVNAVICTQMRLGARRLGERATRWLLAKRRPPLDIDAELAFFAGGVADVLLQLPSMLRGVDASAVTAARESLISAGVPPELAQRSASMDVAFAAMDIVEVSRSSGRPLAEVGATYFALADALSISALLAAVNGLPRDDRWRAMARATLREDLFSAHAALTAEVLTTGQPGMSPDDYLTGWRSEAGPTVERARAMFTEIIATDSLDLAMASVAMRAFRGLLSTPRA